MRPFQVVLLITALLTTSACKSDSHEPKPAESPPSKQEAVAALNHPDPCQVLKFHYSVYSRAGKKAEYNARQNLCNAKRAAATRATTAKHCKEIAQRVAENKLSKEDEQWLKQGGALARRINGTTLTTADLSIPRSKLPCAEAMFPIFVEAVVRADKAWAGLTSADRLSSDLKQAMIQRKSPPSHEVATVMRRLADARAAADSTGARESTKIQAAKDLCQLVDSLLASSSAACKRVIKRHAVLKKRELALAERRQAASERRRRREEARQLRCEKLSERSESCSLNCMDRYDVLDPRAKSCFRRCDARLRRAGCSVE